MLGMEICRLLVEKGKPLRALVRTSSDPERIAALKKMGADLAYGDMKDRQSLDAACQGIDAVISTASSTFSRQDGDSIDSVDRQGQLHVVDAAAAAGVKQFVLVSFVKDPSMPFPLSEAKQEVEDRLKQSGMDYTILEANFFMEVWLSPAIGFDYPNARARVYGDGDSKVSWVSYKDVAQFAVAAVGNPAAKNTVLPVGGPKPLSPKEVIQTFEQAMDKSFEVEYVPTAALLEQFSAAPDPMSKSFAALMLAYAMGNEMDMEPVLEKFPIKLTTLKEYALNARAPSAAP